MVDLTPRQQFLIQELASMMRRFVYEYDMSLHRKDKNPFGISPLSTHRMMEEWTLSTEATPQELDTIYDIMHRTGHNA